MMRTVLLLLLVRGEVVLKMVRRSVVRIPVAGVSAHVIRRRVFVKCGYFA